MIKHVIINCKQLVIGGVGTPLLPPNKYRYIDGRTNFSVCDPIEARSTYEKYSRMYANRYNRRKYVDGAMYCGLFKNCAQIIEPIPGGKYVIN